MSKARDYIKALVARRIPSSEGALRSWRWRTIRYGVAVGFSLLAWIVALLIERELGIPSHLPFAAAVALSTWFGGSGPGILTGVLSIIAIDVSFLPPIGAIELTHSEELVDSLVFLVVALTIGGTTSALRRARLLAEGRAHEVEEMNSELEQQLEQIQTLTRQLQSSNDYLAAAHAESERLGRQAQQLLEVTTALAEAGSLDEVTSVILTKGTKALEAKRAFVMLVDGDHIERLGAMGFPEDMRRRTRLTTLSEDGPVAEAMRTRTPIWVSGADEFRERYPRVYERVGAVSERQMHVIAPLRYGNVLVGALGMSFSEPDAIGAADRAFTLLLADAAAAALQRARSYDAEREKRREAELTARTREEVLGVVAHDLRNPLHLIMATTEMLEEPGLPPERRRELLAVTMRAVKHMRRLVADLLDAVRIQAGRLSLDFEAMTIGAIVDQTEEMYRPLAAEQGLTLEVRALDRPRRVRVDRGRIQQVLGNLLGNALKFTPAGGTVTLEATAGNDSAMFRVRDTGVGIPADRLPHVFDQFWQGSPGDRRGVGLGLAIAKAVVEAHGGTISAESEPGKGSVFTLRLPLAEERRATAALDREPSASRSVQHTQTLAE
jgi:signal transduction histidine kinase